jgi:hypothetical protein
MVAVPSRGGLRPQGDGCCGLRSASFSGEWVAWKPLTGARSSEVETRLG